MTLSVKNQYTELVSLTQLFLLRECSSLKTIQGVSPQTWDFFRKKKGETGSIPTLIQKKASAPPILVTELPPPSRPLPPEGPQILAPTPLPSPEPIAPPNKEPPVQIESKKPEISATPKPIFFALEPMPASTRTFDHQEFWNFFRSHLPHLELHTQLPADTAAHKFKNAWVQAKTIPPILILSFYDQEKHLTFLNHMAQAISLRLAPARVLSAPQLEKENQWQTLLESSHLRLIIASDYGLYTHPRLMQFYRENPQQGKHFLNQVPLLLLSDIGLYLREPQLKALLWRAICNEFTVHR